MAVRRGKGEGCISKRKNGKFRAYVTQNGQKIHYTGATKTECQEWMRNTLNQIDKGLTSKGAHSTLGEYIDEWISTKEKELGPKTYIDYIRYCNKDIIPILGHIKLKDLRLPVINAYYLQLLESGRGESTIKYIHRVLHSALEDAIKNGYLGYNPSDHASLPNKKSHKAMAMKTLSDLAAKENADDEIFEDEFMGGETKVWSESELSQFLITALDSPLYALLDLEAKTGLRVGELLGLLKRDVEFKDDYALIKVRRQVQWVVGHGWIIQTPKTKSGIRTLKVGTNTARVLREHLDSLDTLKELHKKRWKEHGFLFPSSVGTPINVSNLRKQFNQLIKKAGVQKIRIHDIRHTVASILLTNKIPLVIVSKILGHSKPSVTSDIYYHFIPASSNEAADFMDDLTPTVVNLTNLVSVKEGDPAGVTK